MNWFHFKILDNSPSDLVWFFSIIILAFLIRKYISQLIGLLLYRIFKKLTAESYLEKFQSLVVPPLQYVIFFLIVRVAVEMLYYPRAWNFTFLNIAMHAILDSVMSLLIWASVTWLLLRIVDFIGYLMKMHARQTESRIDDQWAPFIKDTLKIIVLVISLLFVLGVILNLNITSVLAGVGIGGLAIALAAQESLKNLFGSLTIFLDKPFMIGDQVKIGDVQGTVEKIGFRSTRIRTADTTYVTLPNKVMVDSSVDNISSRFHMRVRMNLGLRYGIKSGALKKIIEELKEVIAAHVAEHEENYVVFDSFGENSLSISMQYYIPLKPNHEFIKEKEAINFRIMQVIEEHGAEFSYPIQEIRMVNAGNDGKEMNKPEKNPEETHRVK